MIQRHRAPGARPAMREAGEPAPVPTVEAGVVSVAA